MTTAPAIANARRPGQPMSDEQRKAMWANIRGGGGGGSQQSAAATVPTMDEINDRLRAQGIDVYDASKPVTWRDKLKAALGGFFEGAKGGGTILADRLTFGQSESLSKAAEQYQQHRSQKRRFIR